MIELQEREVKRPQRTLHFYWQPKQQQLWDLVDSSPYTRIGYGGARGGGKSHAGREIILARRGKYDNTSGLIFRRLYKDLLENHITPFFETYPQFRQYFNKSESTLALPNGSRIVFGHAEHEMDIQNFHGLEYADIMVDEAQRCTEFMINKLLQACRCTTNNKLTPKFIMTFNPGDINHQYLKRVFVDREYIDNENGDEYTFLQAYGWDNVMWVKKALELDGLTSDDFYSWDNDKRLDYFITRSDYGRTLNQLPDADRRAQLFGDWDVFEGMFFSMWRRDLHVIDPVRPQPEWPVVGALDYGERSVLEVAYRDYTGRIIVFGEVFTEHEAPSLRANAIADYLLEHELYKLRLVYDTNMDIDLSKYSGADKRPAKIFREVFAMRMGDKAPTMIVVSKKTTDQRGYRAVCNEAVKELLAWERSSNGETYYVRRPKLYVTKECRMLIKTLPTLIHDPDSMAGLDFDQRVGIDDPYDALKMAIMELRPFSLKDRESPIHRGTVEQMASQDYVERVLVKRAMSRVRGKPRADTL